MPTIHVSDYVFKEINKRQRDGEAPTDTLRRVLDREEAYIEEVVEDKIAELQRGR